MKKLLSIFIYIFLLISTNQVFAGDYITKVTNANTIGGCKNGKIDLIFTGGHAPFDVEWYGPNGFTYVVNGVSGNTGIEDISNLAPGQYKLVTTDAMCGTRTDTYQIKCITCNQAIVTDKITDPSCNGNGNNGSIDIHITNTSNPSISFNWYKFIAGNWVLFVPMNGGSNGGDLNSISAGKYRLDVLDDGCAVSKEFVLYSTEAPNAHIEIVDPVSTCSPSPFVYQGYYESSKDGILCVAGFNTNNSYKIVWSDGGTGSCRYNLPAGTYSAQIIFPNGCIVELDPVELCCCSNPTEYPAHPNIPFCSDTKSGNPEPVTIKEAILKSASNSTSADGEIHLVLEGSGAVNFFWSPTLPNSGDVTGLNPGTYCVTITNQCSGETDKDCFTVEDCSKKPFTISGTVTNTCEGVAFGGVNITISGGKQPYKFKWSNGKVTQNIADVGVGQYCVTVTEATGCTTKGCFSVGLNSFVNVNSTNPCEIRTFCNGKKVSATPKQVNCYYDDPFDCTVYHCFCSLTGGISGSGIDELTNFYADLNSCAVFGTCPSGAGEQLAYQGFSNTVDNVYKDPSCNCFHCEVITYCDLGPFGQLITDVSAGILDIQTYESPQCPGQCFFEFICNGSLVASGCGPCVGPGVLQSNVKTHFQTEFNQDSLKLENLFVSLSRNSQEFKKADLALPKDAEIDIVLADYLDLVKNNSKILIKTKLNSELPDTLSCSQHCKITPTGTGQRTAKNKLTNDLEIQISPNPFDEQIFITFGSNFSTNIPYEIYNIVGQTVQLGILESQSGQGEFVILTPNLPTGTYSIKIYLENGTSRQFRMIHNRN